MHLVAAVPRRIWVGQSNAPHTIRSIASRFGGDRLCLAPAARSPRHSPPTSIFIGAHLEAGSLAIAKIRHTLVYGSSSCCRPADRRGIMLGLAARVRLRLSAAYELRPACSPAGIYRLIAEVAGSFFTLSEIIVVSCITCWLRSACLVMSH